MIVIRHLSGPHAAAVDRFDAELDRIVFGRGVDCDVLYPADETIIAREHFALVRKPPGPAGHWTIVLFGEAFVAVNGIPAEPGQRLPAEATIELGERGGPSFRVYVEPDAATDNVPATETGEEDDGARVLVERARIAAAKAGAPARVARGVALAGLGAAIIVVAAASYFYASAPKSGISTAVRARLLRSVFQVEAPGGVAAAFPIGPHRLATNAHVGEEFLKLRPGQHMIVRSPGQGGKSYKVVGAKIHPGYKAFSAFLEEHGLGENRVADIGGVGGYDVAILRVAKTLPPDAILQLATPAELRALAPGTRVATAGYPAEAARRSGGEAHRIPPELQVGSITNATNYFFLTADFAHSQLIHDDIPSAPGAGGSPIVDRIGHVIALRNAANFSFLNRGKLGALLPSGVHINDGQRVDVLQRLIAGDADREIAADRSYWAKEFAVFGKGLEALDKLLIARIRASVQNQGLAFTRISEAMGSLTERTRIRNAKGQFERRVEFPVTAAAGAAYVFIGYAHDGSPLQLWVYEGGQLVAHAGTPTDTPAETALPWTIYRSRQNTKLTVSLIHPKDEEATYSFEVYEVARKPKTALNSPSVGVR